MLLISLGLVTQRFQPIGVALEFIEAMGFIQLLEINCAEFKKKPKTATNFYCLELMYLKGNFRNLHT